MSHPGIKVDDIVADLRSLQHGRPESHAPSATASQFPEDIIAQLFPSGDVSPIPLDALVRVEGVTHNARGEALRSDVIVPGSFIVVAPPVGSAEVQDHSLPILVGMAVDLICKKRHDISSLVCARAG